MNLKISTPGKKTKIQKHQRTYRSYSFHSASYSSRGSILLTDRLWNGPQNTYRVEMKYRECICPRSRRVHCNFVRDGHRVKGGGRLGVNPHPHQPGLIFFHHDGMYARNRQSPLCECSVDGTPTCRRNPPSTAAYPLHGSDCIRADFILVSSWPGCWHRLP